MIKSRISLWLPFMAAAGVMILLCLIGDRSENRWFVIWYVIIWLNHLLLLLLFPRNVEDAHAVMAILCLAALCRLVLLSVNIGESSVASGFVSVLFDLGALAMLMGLLHQRGLELRWSILYALNPVVLYVLSAQGNQNAAMLFFLLGALNFYDRKNWYWTFLFAGLSMPFGWVSAAVIPFLFRRKKWKHAWISAPAASLAWIFYRYNGMSWAGFGPSRSIEGLSFRSPIQTLIETLFRSPLGADSASIILLCLVLFYGYAHLHPLRNRLHENDPVSGCFFALGACLLFSPNVSIRSMSWVIAFIALRPSASWALLSLTAGAAFWGVGEYTNSGHMLWVPTLIWVPFGMLLAHDLYLAWFRKKAPCDPGSPTAISVVIPALNEADRIEACIAAAKGHPAVQEIIVVDGGSADDTVEKAQQMNAVTVQLQPGRQSRGRGGQLCWGIQAASKDLVAIVHADTRVNEKIFDKILDLMTKQPMIVGGAVGSVFAAKGWRFRLLEVANDFRMVCMGISFGDQVQFFRREPVVNTDLFPNIPLMEDVEFAVRLHRLGRQAYLFGNAEVSTRRWEKQGMGHALTVIRLFGTYMLQRLWKPPDTDAMYCTYYENREDRG